MTILNFIKNSKPSESDFTAWITPYVKLMHKVALQYTGQLSAAEDLVQDVMTEVFVKQQWPSIEYPKAWLMRCLYNRFIDSCRKNKYLNITDSLDTEQHDIASASRVDSEDVKQQVMWAINQLPPHQRALVSLCDLNGYSLTELSTILDKPLGTLKSDLHRGRQRLKTQLLLQPNANNVRHLG